MGSDTGSLALDVMHSANISSNTSFVPDPVVGGAGDTAMVDSLALCSWVSQSTGETDKSPYHDAPEWARGGGGDAQSRCLVHFRERSGRTPWRRGLPTGM